MSCRRILIVAVIAVATIFAIIPYVDRNFSVDRILPAFRDAGTTIKSGKTTTTRRPSLAPDRRVCLPALLRSSYLLGNLTEVMLQQWRDLNGTDKWQRMAETYNAIWKPYFDHLKPFTFVSDQEYKYFVDFIDPDAECNVITMGLGGTVDGEKKLFARYPQCRFLGVDPSADDNKQLVESIKHAKFIQAAVAGVSGNRQASLKTAGGGYANKETTHMAFVDLLKEHNHGRLVDLIIIDVEGAEYGILPLLTERANDLPTICQINMELHTPPKSYGYDLGDFYDHFTNLLLDARYMPMHIEISGPAKFLRVFMLNIKDSDCTSKFLC